MIWDSDARHFTTEKLDNSVVRTSIYGNSSVPLTFKETLLEDLK